MIDCIYLFSFVVVFDLRLFSIQLIYSPVYVCNEVSAMAGIVLDCDLSSSERDVHRCCRCQW